MRYISILLASAALAGCTVGPDYKGPPATAITTGPDTAFVRAKDPAFTAAPGLARWWEALNDPTLTGLIDEALAHSPTIDQAVGRIAEARGKLRKQDAASLPSLSSSVTYIDANLPGFGGLTGSGAGGDRTNLELYNLGVNASWELDLFGGLKRGSQQARAGVEGRDADLADAQVALSAQVAQAYVKLRDAQTRIELNAQSVGLQERQLGLYQQRLAQGTASDRDFARLQAQLESSRADALPLAAQRDEALNQLAVLAGKAPGALDALLAKPAAAPLPPASVPIGNPAALLARRPDIRSAERGLAAATSGIGVYKAKELPGIKFMGLLGIGGSEPGDMLEWSGRTLLGAPSLNWTFLDFGRTRADTRVAEAKRDQAEGAYQQAVLKALGDTETALSRFGKTRDQLYQLQKAEAAAAKAADLNAQRVEAGTSSAIDQLDIERQRVQATTAVAQTQAQLTLSYIAVNNALGLGWSEPATTTVTAAAAPRTEAVARP